MLHNPREPNFIIVDDYCVNEYTDTNKRGGGSVRSGLVFLKAIDELTHILIR